MNQATNSKGLPKMRAAIYSRVSTADQNTQNQLADLRQFAARQGFEIVAEFIDNGISGGTSKRPAFERMFEAAERNEFDVLLFWSLDRLSREGVLKTLLHLERLTEQGIEYKSYTEQYLDSCGIFREAIIGILSALARQEKLRISERTKAGLQLARAKGKKLGAERIEVNSDILIELYRNGMSTRQIAKQLSISPMTVVRRLNELRDAA